MKEKRANRRHDPETVRRAIEGVKTKRYTLRAASRAFGIPVSTLSDKIKGRVPIQSAHFTLLTADEEVKLKKFILDMSRCGFGLTTDEVRATAKSIIDIRKPPPSSDPEGNMPSHSWVYRLFERHPELTLRTPQSLGKERALVTPQAVENWFAALKRTIDEVDPELLTDPERVFNADESGFGFDPRSRKVVSFMGAKFVYKVTANTKTQVIMLLIYSSNNKLHRINT